MNRRRISLATLLAATMSLALATSALAATSLSFASSYGKVFRASGYTTGTSCGSTANYSRAYMKVGSTSGSGAYSECRLSPAPLTYKVASTTAKHEIAVRIWGTFSFDTACSAKPGTGSVSASAIALLYVNRVPNAGGTRQKVFATRVGGGAENDGVLHIQDSYCVPTASTPKAIDKPLETLKRANTNPFCYSFIASPGYTYSWVVDVDSTGWNRLYTTTTGSSASAKTTMGPLYGSYTRGTC